MARHPYRDENFPHVHTEGQLLPVDALQRILHGDRSMEGLGDEDYGLVGERRNEAINRSWQKMLALWPLFVESTRNLATGDTGTSQTRKYLLLPLLAELGYGQLSQARPEERLVELPDGEKASYPISHFRDESPIHLVGCRVDMDRKTAGVAGASRQSPHSLVQEFLNRSDRHLWGIVSNGLVLRILRDNASLSRQAYVEFDLQGIFEGESFGEFALLWLVAHHSRVHTDGQPPEQCRLEQWMRASHTASVLALESLRACVTSAIGILGQGFMAKNPDLREKLASATLSGQDYFRELLRLAYRLIFLFVLEERNLLHAPGTDPAARERYRRSWSLSRLRILSLATKGSSHHDLWEGEKLVMKMLARDGCPALGLTPLGSFLWSDAAMPDLAGLKLENAALLDALRKLAFTSFGEERRPVDWRNMGAQELGSIYESLLELRPEISGQEFHLVDVRGNERKTSGSYYTPTPLIDCLLESALDPVLDRAARSTNPEAAILGLRICDPACGSGHFLLAAAGRLARRLAAVRSGEEEPSPEAQRHALRDVVSRCIYGVDINPMSVELCRMGLWLESHEPGRPLSFLDHHVVCANTLLGTSAELVRRGMPDDAFKALPGDDRKACTALRKSNHKEMVESRDRSKLYYHECAVAMQQLFDLSSPFRPDDMPGETVADMERKEAAFRTWKESPQWRKKKELYDLWTAAFLLRRHFPIRGKQPDGTPLLGDAPFGVTWRILLDHVTGKRLPEGLMDAVEACAGDFRFFHLEVAFPEVAEHGGFDVILANPPWEDVVIKEKEWLTAHGREDLASLAGAVRKKALARLQAEDPLLYGTYAADQRRSWAIRHYCTASGAWPLMAGTTNLYALFAEWMRSRLADEGLLGCIVPTGMATDLSTSAFFRDMVDTQSLVSLLDLENKGIFPDVHASFKFCLLTTGNGHATAAGRARFVFFARSTEDFGDKEKNFTLTARDFALLNPNTLTCPVFRCHRDAELTKAICRRVPVLVREARGDRPEGNPWGLFFRTMFHMTNDSHLFRTRDRLEAEGFELAGNILVEREAGQAEILSGRRFLPLYEGKMIHHFDHRWATYDGPDSRTTAPEERQDSTFAVLPRYWVAEGEVEKALAPTGWSHPWLMGWRDICRATDERTAIFSLLPRTAVGHKIPLIFSAQHGSYLPLALALLSSFAFDYVTRQKLGGTDLTYSVLKQLPVLPPAVFSRPAPWQAEGTLAGWLWPRLLELVYTAEDMRPFAEDMGYKGDPFPWDEERRLALRCELDAACFHLYLPATPDGHWKQAEGETDEEYTSLIAAFPKPRDAVGYIMDTFPIVKKNDEKTYGRFRTKEAVLEDYDCLQAAIRG